MRDGREFRHCQKWKEFSPSAVPIGIGRWEGIVPSAQSLGEGGLGESRKKHRNLGHYFTRRISVSINFGKKQKKRYRHTYSQMNMMEKPFLIDLLGEPTSVEDRQRLALDQCVGRGYSWPWVLPEVNTSIIGNRDYDRTWPNVSIEQVGSTFASCTSYSSKL